jgi:hypothetical protein
MPSCTVPMCSNSVAISHITQCEMPLSRKAIAVAAATAPTPTAPGPQPQAHEGGGGDQAHAEHLVDGLETRHQPHLAVGRDHELLHRAACELASRLACENSLTVAMLV